MDMNRVQMIGRLVRDPEQRNVGDHTVCNITLAVNSWKKDDPALFIKCAMWDKTAEIAMKYLVKGAQCLVEGRLNIEEYKTKNDEQRREPVIVVDRLSLGEKPKGAEDRPREDRPSPAPRPSGGSGYGPPPPGRGKTRQEEPAGDDDIAF